MILTLIGLILRTTLGPVLQTQVNNVEDKKEEQKEKEEENKK